LTISSVSISSWGLVVAQAQDPRKAQGEAALVAVGARHRVECDLDHDFGLDGAADGFRDSG